MTEITSFQISHDESRLFAAASGDFNPLHVDPVSARRTQFGHTLIHGVCGTLRALDLWLANREAPIALSDIRVKYLRPITQRQPVKLVQPVSEKGTRLEIIADDIRCQIIDFNYQDVSSHPSGASLDCSGPDMDLVSDLLTIDECDDLKGSVPLRWHEQELGLLFPNATRLLPPVQIATLLASTDIVGMRCPGLHSVFAQLSLSFEAPRSDVNSKLPCDDKLSYHVSYADARINLVKIDVETALAKGSIEAFFRAPPAQQASFKKALERVPQNAFASQKALVVGASRGLGEVISKVLAAGGADVTMTYAAGQADTEALAQEISSGAAITPKICQYNVLANERHEEFQDFDRGITHIYYLASPKIQMGDPANWNESLYQHFRKFYLTGLESLIASTEAHTASGQPLQLFIPSSVFLEENVRGFAEYIAAKKEAEDYAQSLVEQGRVMLAMPRLPRLLTDQTSGVKGLSAEDTLDQITKTLASHYSN